MGGLTGSSSDVGMHETDIAFGTAAHDCELIKWVCTSVLSESSVHMFFLQGYASSHHRVEVLLKGYRRHIYHGCLDTAPRMVYDLAPACEPLYGVTRITCAPCRHVALVSSDTALPGTPR